jgi:flagellar hook protein FlgE
VRPRRRDVAVGAGAAKVDRADGLPKMSVTPRAYSANGRVITTADEMLDELISISG